MIHGKHPVRFGFLILAIDMGLLAADPPSENASRVRMVDYTPAIILLEQVIQEELKQGELPGVAIALVDDQQTVLARGYGMADKRRNVAATSQSVYRAGSISKLFTAIAAMQLVEQGKLDIDKPVTTFDPEFRITVPFPDAEPITLRHLMCHRSGLIRESPVGSYFDPSEPSMTETVASIASCVLVHPPNTCTKYSNVGPTVTGCVVERAAGIPFAEYQQRYVLGPLGMEDSSFVLNARLRERYAPGNMWVADGHGGFKEIEAPHFKLGTLSAGNLYTTAEDLARFLSCLFADGHASGQPLLKPETLQAMFAPQSVSEDTGYGLGFSIGTFSGHKTIGHSGAVYGHSAWLRAIPEHKIGVVVLTNEDLVSGITEKIGQIGLERMLEAKLGQIPQKNPQPIPIEPAALDRFTGDYESESYWAHLEVDQGILMANISGQRLTLEPIEAEAFLADGRFCYRESCTFQCNDSAEVTGFQLLSQKFTRVDPNKTVDVPEAWHQFLGSYGPEFIPLVVRIQHGHLYAMTENMVDYRLTPLNRTVFKMPPGMYVDEQLVFQIGPDGKVHSAILANMTLPRRPN